MYVGVMRKATCAAVLAAALFASLPVVIGNSQKWEPVSTSAQAETKRYKIYCVNGKVEISTRELSDMKSLRGSQVCLLESFDSLAEATKAAKRHGGVGGDCACRA